MDVKYVYERIEDFIRAVKADKIKAVFFTQEVIPTGESRVLAVIRLTAVSHDSTEHFTLNEIAYNGARREDDGEVITEAITLKKNKIQEQFSTSAPDVLLIAGAVFP